MIPDVEVLGTLRRAFRPKAGNIGAGSLIGLALVVGGLSLAVFLARRHDPRPLGTGDRIAKYAFIGVLGVGAPIGGIALLVWMKRLAGHRVNVYDEGFSYEYAGTTEVCRWTELEKIDEVFTQEELKVLKVRGAVIKNVDRSFVLHRKDGHEFRFTVNSIDSISRLAAFFEEARRKYGIPWERVEVS